MCIRDSSCAERTVRLSRKEFDMMELLMLNQRQVVTKETLLVKIWGYESDAEDNNVEVYICLLYTSNPHRTGRTSGWPPASWRRRDR